MKSKKNMLGKAICISVCILSITISSMAMQQVKAKAKSMVIKQRKILPPKLEVQQFSGEMARWVQMMELNAPQSLWFKWTHFQTAAKGAIMEVRVGSINSGFNSSTVRNQENISPIPDAGKGKMFKLNPFRTIRTKPCKIYFRIRMLNSEGNPIGYFSNTVTIIYKKQSQIITKFQLDQVKIVKLEPSTGPIQGPPAHWQSLSDNNSLKITYFYELITSENADIRQWLLNSKGGVAANNFWLAVPVTKGKGQTYSRATIKCESANQAPTLIYAIKYKLITPNGTLLFEGKKMLNPPIKFVCSKSQ